VKKIRAAPLRVLHVIPSVAACRGGPSFTIRSMTAVLARMGCEIQVVSSDDDCSRRMSVPTHVPVDEDGITYWFLPRTIHFYTMSHSLPWWLHNHMSDFHVVHVHALFSFFPVVAAAMAARRRIPYVVRPLGTLNYWGLCHRRRHLKRLSLKFIEGPLLRRAAAIQFSSDQEFAEARAATDVTRGVVIPNPVDFGGAVGASSARFVARHPELQGRRIVLFLSRIDEKKGLQVLIGAVSRLKESLPEVALVIAGDGPGRLAARLRYQAASLGIETDTFWVGFLAGQEKWDAFAAAEVFVLPSFSENLGVAVIEAAASGTPVLLTEGVALHERVTGAEAGLVVRCDEAELTLALERLLADGELRRTLGRNGRRLAEDFGPEVIGERLVSLYEQVVCS
jgi:glycosyltransferase involved in cell wall biosynthesis